MSTWNRQFEFWKRKNERGVKRIFTPQLTIALLYIYIYIYSLANALQLAYHPICFRLPKPIESTSNDKSEPFKPISLMRASFTYKFFNFLNSFSIKSSGQKNEDFVRILMHYCMSKSVIFQKSLKIVKIGILQV